ncbi:MAG: hypothetical protein GF383_03105 [Candidatus Lokiarchaeota archaeon]|nr:hypothetical protein [Candidatus Lokiarchaeota archaeon]MBD3338528.1 hypothetical protein [Candidatus Lokiarchaeota archaeon]
MLHKSEFWDDCNTIILPHLLKARTPFKSYPPSVHFSEPFGELALIMGTDPIAGIISYFLLRTPSELCIDPCRHKFTANDPPHSVELSIMGDSIEEIERREKKGEKFKSHLDVPFSIFFLFIFLNHLKIQFESIYTKI